MLSHFRDLLETFQAVALSQYSPVHWLHQKPLPPGPGSFPFLGLRVAKRMQDNPLRTFLDFYDEFGPVFTTRLLGGKLIWLIGPEANHTILLKDHKNFSWRKGFLGDLIPFLGDGLLTTDGQQHDRARALIQPLFKKDRIRQYSDEMVKRASLATAKLQPDQEIEIYHWTRDLALEIATLLLFGIHTEPSLRQQLSHHFERGLHYFGVFYHLQFLRGTQSPWGQMLNSRAHIDALLFSEIKRRQHLPPSSDNILDLLLNARLGHEQLSHQEIRDHVMTLLFAGHDTSTATVSWMLALLGQHRHVYQKLQSEIDTVLGDQTPNFDHLMGGLPYLDQVLAETLRLYPPAWIGPRLALKDFEIYGHHIPAGTNVAYSSWLSHRLPHVFPDPDAFDPERFTTEKIKALPPGAYVPFGWGPRLCIGKQFGELEIKAIICCMLQRFHFELLPGQLFGAHTMPTISPKHGVRMRVRSRHTPPSTHAQSQQNTHPCPAQHPTKGHST